MATINSLKEITKVAGVRQYMLLGPTGKIIAHNMEGHILISSMIISCLTICKTIKKIQFRYLIFTQKDNRDLFLFPVGKYYLGIIKKSEYKAAQLPKNIYKFIMALNKRVP